MPTTTTAVTAAGCKISIADETATMRDVSGSLNKADIKFSNDLGEFGVFGDSAKYRTERLVDAEVDLTIIFSTTANEALDILKRWRSLRGSRQVIIDMPVSSAGADRYTGNFKYADISIPLGAEEAKPIMVTANLKADGPVTRTTIT